MPVQFFGSQNARFIVGLEGRELFLLKDYREVWRKELGYTNYHVVGIGNSGNTVLQSDQGLIIFSPNAREPEMIIEDFRRHTLDEEHSILGKVKMDQQGERLCIEKITMKSKLSEKLLTVFGTSSKQEKGQAFHQLLFYELETKRQTIFYRFEVDRRVPHAFHWEISPDFTVLIWGEAQKAFKGADTSFTIADFKTRDESKYDRFVLEGLTEWQLFINNAGISLIDSPQRKAKRDILVSNSEGDKFKLTVLSEYAVSHLGRNFVAFQSRMGPYFQFKRFDDRVFQEVDLSGIEKLEMDYQVLFTERDDIHFVARKGGQVKIVHTNIERFSTDARRWEMMAEQHVIDTEISTKREALEQKQTNLRHQQDRVKSDELMKTVLSRKKEKQGKRADVLNQKILQLNKLDQLFEMDSIDKQEYFRRKKELESEIYEIRMQIGDTMVETHFVPQTDAISGPSGATNIVPPADATVSIRSADAATNTLSLPGETTERPDLRRYTPSSTYDSLFDELNGPRESIEVPFFDDAISPDIPVMEFDSVDDSFSAPSYDYSMDFMETDLPDDESITSDLAKKPGKKAARKKVIKKRSRTRTKQDTGGLEFMKKASSSNETGPEAQDEISLDYDPDMDFSEVEPVGILEDPDELMVTPPAKREDTPDRKSADVPERFAASAVSTRELPPAAEETRDLPSAPENLAKYEVKTPPVPVSEAVTSSPVAMDSKLAGQVKEPLKSAESRIPPTPRPNYGRVNQAEYKDRQIEKYHQLLKELEDSNKTGGISLENYYRLRKKYEERIQKFQEK